MGPLHESLSERIYDEIDALVKVNFTARLWKKDSTLWKEKAEDRAIIDNALGWLALPESMSGRVRELKAFAGEARKAGFRRVALLGMGGSSLAPLVISETFGAKKGFPRLVVLDSTDPEAVRRVEKLGVARTLFIVSSKSGSTIEPLSLFRYFYGKVARLKKQRAGSNFISITDPGTKLEALSKELGFRRVFLNPWDIGGRFSALSLFGLVPAALMGVDISRLLKSAAKVSASMRPDAQAGDNPALTLGATLGTLASSGRDKLTFMLSKEISSFGLWIEQLIAESTGKEGKGLVPVAGEKLGGLDGYKNDRVFIHIFVKRPDKKIENRLIGLYAAGHPVLSIALDDLYSIGGEFLKWEAATAVAGRVMGINPFDQPDVELSKRLTMKRLDAGMGRAAKPPGKEIKGRGYGVYLGKRLSGMIKKRGADARAAADGFIGSIRTGDYAGLLAYYDPGDKAAGRELIKLREAISRRSRAAVEFGYGPRYLHSTGQLHKGGADNGVFLIICHKSGGALRIPGSPFGFPELILSQAFGDMEALEAKGRRVMMIALDNSKAKGLERVAALFKG